MQTNEVLDCFGRVWEFPWEQEYEEYLESQEYGEDDEDEDYEDEKDEEEDEEGDDFGVFWDTKGL